MYGSSRAFLGEKYVPSLALRHLIDSYIMVQDMDRLASPIVSLTFEGPDVEEQSLYQLFRVCFPYRSKIIIASLMIKCYSPMGVYGT
jgi:hypothetical protein